MTDSVRQSIRDTMLSVAPEAKTILYGSRVRGDFHDGSDIDLLILLPDSLDGKEFVRKKSDISGKLYDLSLEIGIDISPLILVPKVFFARTTPFTINVKKDGIEL